MIKSTKLYPLFCDPWLIGLKHLRRYHRNYQKINPFFDALFYVKSVWEEVEQLVLVLISYNNNRQYDVDAKQKSTFILLPLRQVSLSHAFMMTVIKTDDSRNCWTLTPICHPNIWQSVAILPSPPPRAMQIHCVLRSIHWTTINRSQVCQSDIMKSP